jgi:predicted patatin/cPLA2 family phospholipase
MRCAWSGGFLCALQELGLRPGRIIASSGNVGNAVYFAAGQSESIRRIWTEHLPGKRFISFVRFWKIIDIDYLVDEVMSISEPIRWDDVKRSVTAIICPLHRADGAQVRTYTNIDIDYSVIKAAKALPFLYGKQIILDGYPYRDYPFCPSRLLTYDSGLQNIILVDVREKNAILKCIRTSLYGRDNIVRETDTMFVLEPKIQAHLLSRSHDTLRKTFQDGYAYVYENQNLLKCFFETL